MDTLSANFFLREISRNRGAFHPRCSKVHLFRVVSKQFIDWYFFLQSWSHVKFINNNQFLKARNIGGTSLTFQNFCRTSFVSRVSSHHTLTMIVKKTVPNYKFFVCLSVCQDPLSQELMQVSS